MPRSTTAGGGGIVLFSSPLTLRLSFSIAMNNGNGEFDYEPRQQELMVARRATSYH